MEGRKARRHYADWSVNVALNPAECASFPLVTQALATETAAIEIQFKSGDNNMSDVAYVSNVRIERKLGPVRIAHLPGEPQPVIFSVHGAVAEHYKVDSATLKESHASTLDYVIAATAG
jgi:hypothetical protein